MSYSQLTMKAFLPQGTKPTKGRTVEVTINGVTISVKIKPFGSVSRKFLTADGFSNYDMYEAAAHFKSSGEVQRELDPNNHSGAYFKPRIDSSAVKLNKSEVEDRLAFIQDFYKLLNNDDIVTAIADFAQKKKDGTLYKKRHTRIASAGVVNGYAEVFEIEGYATSDTGLEIRPAWVDFTDELEQIEKDFISSYPDVLNNKAPAVSTKDTPSAKAKPICFSSNVSDKVIKVVPTINNGEIFIGNTPLSKYPFIKKKSGQNYFVDFTLPVLDNMKDMEYKNFFVDGDGYKDAFGSIFAGLSVANCSTTSEFNTIADSIESYINKNRVNKSEVKIYPKEIPVPSYSKEKSLILVFDWFKKLSELGKSDFLSFFSKLAVSSSDPGQLKIRQNVIFLASDFYAPSRNFTEILAVYQSMFPVIGVRTAMNTYTDRPPLRTLYIEFTDQTKQRYSYKLG